MQKQFLFLIIFCILCCDTNAQRGNNTVSVNIETPVPFFQNDKGFGFFLKGSYGIDRFGQLTFSGGVSKFNSKNSIDQVRITTRLLPFLFGYKQNIGKFFIEPRIGIGELGGKISINGDYSRPSVAALYSGLGAGNSLKRMDFGINFLNAHGIENTSAGIWNNKNFHYTSIYVGYNFHSGIRQ